MACGTWWGRGEELRSEVGGDVTGFLSRHGSACPLCVHVCIQADLDHHVRENRPDAQEGLHIEVSV